MDARFPKRAAAVVGIVLGACGVAALLIFLSSLHAWWADTLALYLEIGINLWLPFGAYAGWALDDCDDPREERRAVIGMVISALVAPALMVLVAHVAMTTFGGRASQWPLWLDITTRAAVCFVIIELAVTVAIGLALRWIKGAQEPSRGT